MGANASQITSLTVVYSTVYSGVDQRKHKSSASLAFIYLSIYLPVMEPAQFWALCPWGGGKDAHVSVLVREGCKRGKKKKLKGIDSSEI